MKDFINCKTTVEKKQVGLQENKQPNKQVHRHVTINITTHGVQINQNSSADFDILTFCHL